MNSDTIKKKSISSEEPRLKVKFFYVMFKKNINVDFTGSEKYLRKIVKWPWRYIFANCIENEELDK